jgi:valyl-tRNA synthetase
VCIAAWPVYPDSWRDEAMETRLRRMQDLVGLVREIRNRYKVDTKTALDISVRCASGVAEDFRLLSAFITQLAGVGKLETGPNVSKPRQSATQVHADFELYVSLVGLIDVAAETKRLTNQKSEKERSLQGARGKLSNESFTARAPAEVVQQVREQVADLEGQLKIIEETLRDLQQA